MRKLYNCSNHFPLSGFWWEEHIMPTRYNQQTHVQLVFDCILHRNCADPDEYVCGRNREWTLLLTSKHKYWHASFGPYSLSPRQDLFGLVQYSTRRPTVGQEVANRILVIYWWNVERSGCELSAPNCWPNPNKPAPTLYLFRCSVYSNCNWFSQNSKPKC